MKKKPILAVEIRFYPYPDWARFKTATAVDVSFWRERLDWPVSRNYKSVSHASLARLLNACRNHSWPSNDWVPTKARGGTITGWERVEGPFRQSMSLW